MNNNDDKLDFEENEFSKLIEDIKKIEPLEVSENFDKKFSMELANAKPELPFKKKMKYIFSFTTKVNPDFFPHIIRYRILTGLSISMAAIVIITLFIYYPKQSEISNQQIAKNEKRKAKIEEQRAKSEEQKVISDEQMAKAEEHKAKSQEKKVRIEEQIAENGKQQEIQGKTDMSIAMLVKEDFEEVTFADVVRNSESVSSRGTENEINEYIPESYIAGDKYKGDLKEGNFDGKGILMKKNGDKYEGNFRKGIYNGMGTYLWTDGTKYIGNWKDGRFSGEGILTLKDSTKIKCIWENGELNGNGTLNKLNEEKYTGGWKNGKANGKGTYIWKNGAKYKGEWKDGIIEGKGTLITKDGKKYTGFWKNNKLIPK